MFDLHLQGKSAIVTGAAFGLGRTYAEALAAEGVQVAVADVNDAEASNVAEQIRAGGGRAVAVHADVADESSVAAMVDDVATRLGGVDILVNNAGWRPRPHGSHYDDVADDFQDAAGWRRILDVNVVGPLICARACRQPMSERGGGVVVNATSIAAYHRPNGPYGVSKLACSAMTVHLADELAPDNIRVNGIAPGVMTQRFADPAELERWLSRQAIKRPGEPADLVGTLLYLVSDMSSFVTGVNVVVDGGVVMRP